jgi:DNA invertase Pin-like site-specific DNA recombinase
MSQTIGYARVSAADQNPDLQLDALAAAGCDRVFVEKMSGAARERPQLAAALEYVRPGDVLVVWKLDRLGRSLRHLLDTVAALEQRDVGFRSLKESIDTTTATGRLIFHIFAASLRQAARAVDVGRSTLSRHLVPKPGLSAEAGTEVSGQGFGTADPAGRGSRTSGARK